MTITKNDAVADEPRGVAAIYEDGAIAASYLDKRMQFSWQRVLHRVQVRVLNDVLARYAPAKVLEIAPGPARLATELRGVRQGVMVENSAEMISIAVTRLQRAGLSALWQVLAGNAFELGAAVSAATFDFAYTFRFIRHFREPERAQLYSQIGSRLAPGGLLMFDVVNATVRDRLDAKNPRPASEIAIYDASYSPASFAAEMRKHGFEVLALHPVVKHFGVQSLLGYKLEDRLPRTVSALVAAIEKLPGSAPLEWVALCRKL